MRKDALLCSMALALLGCGSAQAAAEDHFYVGASAGQSIYPAPETGLTGAKSSMDRHDLAYGIRFGYRWSGPIEWGVESGLVKLGQISGQYSYVSGLSTLRNITGKAQLDTRAITLGLTGRYVFGAHQEWLISARGGLLRGRSDIDQREDTHWSNILGTASGFYTEAASHSDTYTSWYAGVGVGYRITPQLSLSLAYDSYRVKTSYAVSYARLQEYLPDYRHSVGVSSLYLEYAF